MTRKRKPAPSAKVTISVASVVRIRKPGQKSVPMRPEDALIFLQSALEVPPRSQLWQDYLEAALMAYYLGLLNQRHFNVRGDPRGRPRGARYTDTDLLKVMREIAEKTGERRPRKLARHAIDLCRPSLEGAQEESVIRRLAGKWKAQFL